MAYYAACSHCGEGLIRACEGIYRKLTCLECKEYTDIEIKDGIVKILRVSKDNADCNQALSA
ncbi:MAG: hypothetical protein FWC11_01845 [Firmicutes bacterium]|nr:hypothetical protein [Bacillota bacterium]